MKKTLDLLTKIYRLVLVVMTAIIVILGIYEVLGRHLYALGWNTSWTEEAMRYIYVGIIMLGLASVTRDECFTAVTSITDLISRKSKIGKEIIYAFQSVVHVLCFALLFYYGLKLDISASDRLAATTRIAFNFIYLPIPIGSFLAMAIKVIQIFEHYRKPKPTTMKEGESA